MIKSSTDCVYCNAAVIRVDGRWEHLVVDDLAEDGYYTVITCDPLLFEDRRHRVATPKVASL
ncbi:hypothetical protein ACFFX1_55650 [Dactylosporangium sucinum]|uniref:Uncharacterized protein n=1 Tax=Dactylosporangium sucinum TaxID=1424081 RepID=A0A917U3G6_9ACTN|nr:hypothetical protein [Dactylosporangium sucinum]GGM52287.1 hypothetical protein GCM10007977_062340 [Dactylosporangium sucinum]